MDLTQAVSPETPACDRTNSSDGKQNCGKPSVFSYTWEWGESGSCCAEHQFLLQQSASQIGRSVQFASLAAAGPAPLDRPERTRLKGEIYALDEETKELKARGLELYRQNGLLTMQVQAVTVRSRETEHQLRDAAREIERVTTELAKRDAEHGELVNELDRLRVLSAFVQNPATGLPPIITPDPPPSLDPSIPPPLPLESSSPEPFVTPKQKSGKHS